MGAGVFGFPKSRLARSSSIWFADEFAKTRKLVSAIEKVEPTAERRQFGRISDFQMVRGPITPAVREICV